jgi:hypothetical protein
MSYPRQEKTIEKYEAQMKQVLRKIRQSGMMNISLLWDQTKTTMKNHIRDIYRRDFGRQPWSLAMAARRGTMHRIDMMVGHVLGEFQQESISMVTKYLKDIYRQSTLRQAHILDSITPPSYKVHMPKNRMFSEVDIKTYQGPEADTAWKVRWSAWLDTYRTALNSNIKLGAMNSSSAMDVEDEVDATRAGTPAYETGDALNRIFNSQAISTQAQAQLDLADMNEDMDIEEIWQTSFGSRVCDICDGNLGKTRDEADDDIPAHPNCECYWRLVPAQWADLLKNGDASEAELAKWMDSKGIVPSSMVIRDEDGDPAGQVSVSFESWSEGQQKVIAGS